MRGKTTALSLIAVIGVVRLAFAGGPPPDAAAVERGRIALTQTGYLRPAWKSETYFDVAKLWGTSYPDPKADPEGYAAAFNRRYGLHPAPFPNDGLPLGLRRGVRPDGTKDGIQIDCMACHGGSIGGTSYVGLGNSTLDLKSLFDDLTRAEGRRAPFATFVLNSTRGTVNAGQVAALLLSLKNTDFTPRMFPLPLKANLPEIDTPPWWRIGRKETIYYDGRTDADSVRTNMQFIMAEKSLHEMVRLEPAFRDIQAYLKSLKPPKYPFPIDPARAERGKAVFEKSCVKCHGTYGPDGVYPNVMVGLNELGVDRARAEGMSRELVEHYNATWLGEGSPGGLEPKGYQAPPLDGIWATAPYLHNASVPTLHALLNSSERPKIYRRPESTSFDHFDQTNVGWKTKPLDSLSADFRKLPQNERHYYFDASRTGLGNGGHTYGDKLSEPDRMALIEYLKTL